MKKYYIDENTSELIVFDSEEKEISVFQEIEQVEFEEDDPEESPARKSREKKEKSGKGVEKKHRWRLSEKDIDDIKFLTKRGLKPKQISENLKLKMCTVYKYYKQFNSKEDKEGFKDMKIGDVEE